MIDDIQPNFGPLQGGTTVTITGSGFLGGGAPPNHVVFGDIEAAPAAAIDDVTLEVTVPPGTTAGPADIIVFNRNGTVTASGKFHYSDEPTITSVSPTEILFDATDTTVTITGTGFQEENAGVNTVLLNGEPAVDVKVVSDTEITFTALPKDPLVRPDVQVVNARGAGTLAQGLLYIPSANPVLVVFPVGRQGASNYATFFDPMTGDKIVSNAHVPWNTQNGGYRAVFTDPDGNFWAVERDDKLGKIDFDSQLLTDVQQVGGARVGAAVTLGSTTFVADRNTSSFGTLDLATGTYNKIGNIGTCCQYGLATDGTNLFISVANTIAKIDPTSGVRSNIQNFSKPEHVGELRFINGTLFGDDARTGTIFSLDPANGAVVELGNVGPASAIEVFVPGGVQ